MLSGFLCEVRNDQAAAAEVKQVRGVVERQLKGASEVVALPFQLTVTPYLVCSTEGVGGKAEDYLYLQRHKKSGLLIPIGGGKIDPSDKNILSGMLREFFEEADTLPSLKKIVGPSKSDLFDLGVIRDAQDGTLRMLDLRRAFRIRFDQIGKYIVYNENPTDGIARGDDATIVPLSLLLDWGKAAENSSAKPHEIAHHNGNIVLSHETARAACARDPHYFRRYERLAQRLRFAGHEQALNLSDAEFWP